MRPYVPRFLREGDRADLKVVVNNAAERALTGELHFDIWPIPTPGGLLARVRAEARPRRTAVQGGAGGAAPTSRSRWPRPRRVGHGGVQGHRRAGNLCDGELRPLPVLPAACTWRSRAS